MKLSLPLAAVPVAALLIASAPQANAHVSLEYSVALAASPYKATFQVGHGCGASSTRQISIDIPAGVTGARPMPKPGWTLETGRAKLPVPVVNHGQTVTEDVVRVTWTARTQADALPSSHYDQFVLVARLPAAAGTLWWPVRQVCEEGSNNWTELPAPGASASTLKFPAAQLDVLPADGAHAH